MERRNGTTAMNIGPVRPHGRPPGRITTGTAVAPAPGPRPPLAGDRIAAMPSPDLLGPSAAAAVRAGNHQIVVVDGRRLTYPSQNLAIIQSLRPDQPGQTHALARHVGTTLAQNVARLEAAPFIRAAGSFTSAADAQFATDHTIANPANQRAIGGFLADTGRAKTALLRVDLGRTVGSTTFRADVVAGTARLVPGTTATVVLIKDASFPEGYRVLTSYPDTRPPEVDRQGNVLP